MVLGIVKSLGEVAKAITHTGRTSEETLKIIENLAIFNDAWFGSKASIEIADSAEYKLSGKYNKQSFEGEKEHVSIKEIKDNVKTLLNEGKENQSASQDKTHSNSHAGPVNSSIFKRAFLNIKERYVSFKEKSPVFRNFMDILFSQTMERAMLILSALITLTFIAGPLGWAVFGACCAAIAVGIGFQMNKIANDKKYLDLNNSLENSIDLTCKSAELSVEIDANAVVRVKENENSVRNIVNEVFTEKKSELAKKEFPKEKFYTKRTEAEKTRWAVFKNSRNIFGEKVVGVGMAIPFIIVSPWSFVIAALSSLNAYYFGSKNQKNQDVLRDHLKASIIRKVNTLGEGDQIIDNNEKNIKFSQKAVKEVEKEKYVEFLVKKEILEAAKKAEEITKETILQKYYEIKGKLDKGDLSPLEKIYDKTGRGDKAMYDRATKLFTPSTALGSILKAVKKFFSILKEVLYHNSSYQQGKLGLRMENAIVNEFKVTDPSKKVKVLPDKEASIRQAVADQPHDVNPNVSVSSSHSLRPGKHQEIDSIITHY